MVQLSLFVVALAAISANGAPLRKRIAQVIADSTAQWEKACLAAGGGEKCNPVSVTAFTTLLAAAGPCDQQNSADAMINLARTLNNDPTMIKLSQIFAQQPRNTPSSQSVPYCQLAPKNPELRGLFQCQFAGADPTTFVGGTKVGGAGTIPFGHSKALNPPGSCPANPQGPIADGTQLVDITQNPGVGGVKGQAKGKGGNGGGGKANGATKSSSAAPPAKSPSAASADSGTKAPADKVAAGGAGGGGDFHLQNGKDAQALNAKFNGLTENSPCNDGDDACINGGFAQCVGGKFAVTGCAASTQCFALPLVNKPGTSIACTTQADATARFAATGATGGASG